MRFDLNWGPATVRRIADVASDVRLFEIVPDDGRDAVWAPGSHIVVGLVIDGLADTRSYSLVGEPDGTALRIAVKRAEKSRGGSRAMWALAEGARLTVSDPHNLFEVDWTRPEYLLVAGGIGITPIHGMATALARHGARLRLVYAGRRAADMPFVAELGAALGDRLEVFADDQGRRIDVAAEIARLAPGAGLYVCGPLGLLDDARRAWAAAGRPAADLRYETFGSSGAFAPEPFLVRIPRLGREILVPETRSMLDALNEAGVEVMSDCERGECGLCSVDVLAVEGRLDHRDVFFSDAQKRENNKLCACVSRAVGGAITIDTAYRPE